MHRSLGQVGQERALFVIDDEVQSIVANITDEAREAGPTAPFVGGGKPGKIIVAQFGRPADGRVT